MTLNFFKNILLFDTIPKFFPCDSIINEVLEKTFLKIPRAGVGILMTF